MRSRIFLFCFVLIISFTTNNSNAQSAGANILLGFPMNEFKENVKRTGFGGSLQFLLRNPSPQYPYSLGLNVGYINYGMESRREPFSSTIPDVTVDVDRTNNIVDFHLLAQIIPPTGSVRPYLELLFGGSYIFTETTIKSSGHDDVASSNNFDDWAWSYGGGAGFLINLISFDNPANKVSSVYLDFKVRYLYGTEAEYLKEGSVIINNGQVIYEVSKSKTDLLTANIGAVVYFGNLFGAE